MQKNEVETIVPRSIDLNLSDADCERITLKAAEHGLKVSELLEAFIGDLVDGTRTNGSDERMLANQWLDRCYFGMFPQKSLYSYLLYEDISNDPEGFLDDIRTIENLNSEIKDLEEALKKSDEWENIVRYNGEPCYKSEQEYIEEYQNDIEGTRKEVEMYMESFEEVKAGFAEYMKEENYNFDEELQKLKTIIENVEGGKLE